MEEVAVAALAKELELACADWRGKRGIDCFDMFLLLCTFAGIAIAVALVLPSWSCIGLPAETTPSLQCAVSPITDDSNDPSLASPPVNALLESWRELSPDCQTNGCASA